MLKKTNVSKGEAKLLARAVHVQEINMTHSMASQQTGSILSYGLDRLQLREEIKTEV